MRNTIHESQRTQVFFHAVPPNFKGPPITIEVHAQPPVQP